jgi:hypothetical protein
MKRTALISLFAITTLGVASCSTTSPTTSQTKFTMPTKAVGKHGSLSLTPSSTKPVAPPSIPASTTTSPPSSTLPTPPPPTAPVVVPTTAPPVTTTPVSPAITTGGWTYEAATRVAVCESGGWGRGTGGRYVGDLGILVTNWASYGGGSDTSPAAQIAVASRIQSYPPDQNGCTGGW